MKGVLWVSVRMTGAFVTEGGETDLGRAGSPTDRKGMKTRKDCYGLCPPPSLEPSLSFLHGDG